MVDGNHLELNNYLTKLLIVDFSNTKKKDYI